MYAAVLTGGAVTLWTAFVFWNYYARFPWQEISLLPILGEALAEQGSTALAAWLAVSLVSAVSLALAIGVLRGRRAMSAGLPLAVLAWFGVLALLPWFIGALELGWDGAQLSLGRFRGPIEARGWLVDAALLAPILGGCYTIGRYELQRLRIDSRGLESWAVSTSVGYVAVYLLLMVLGVVRLYESAVFWAIVACLSLAWVWQLAAGVRSSRSVGGWRFRWPRLRFDWEALVVAPSTLLIVVFLGIYFLASLAPDLSPDTLHGHLTVGRLFWERHGLVEVDDLQWGHVPSFSYVFYAMGFGLRGQVLAQLISFSWGILFLAAVYALTLRLFDGRVGLLAVALVISVPAVGLQLVSTTPDTVFSLYGMIALLAFVAWTRDRQDRWNWAMGVALGACSASKSTGLPLTLLVGLLWAAILFARERSMRRVVSASLIPAALWSLVAFPVYLKTFAETGNPVFPVQLSILSFLPDKYPEYWNTISSGAGYGFGQSARSALELPWLMTFHGEKMLGPVGPLFIIFVPLGLLMAFSKAEYVRYVALLLVFLFGFTAVWFLVQQVARWYEIGFAILAILSAFGVRQIASAHRSRSGLPAVVLSIFYLGIALNLPAYKGFWLNEWYPVINEVPLSLAFGSERSEQYLETWHGPGARAMAYINQNLPRDSVILDFNSGVVQLYTDAETIEMNRLNRLQFPRRLDMNASLPTLVRQLREAGVTHIAVGHLAPGEYAYPSIEPRSRLLNRYFRPVFTKETAVDVYAFEPEGADNPTEVRIDFETQFAELANGPPESEMVQPDFVYFSPSQYFYGLAPHKHSAEDISFAFPLTIPANAEIEFGLAMPVWTWTWPGSISARVLVRTPDAGEVTVFKGQIEPSRPEHQRVLWQNVDLGEFAGVSGEVVFVVDAAAGASGFTWVQPRLLVRTAEN